MIETLVLGPLQTNSYIVYKGNCAVVIDPADEGDYIAQKLNEMELELYAILATHGHHDHLAGATALQLITNTPLYISKKDIDLLQRLQSTHKHFTGSDPGPNPNNIVFVEEDKLSFPSLKFEVVKLPGHTQGGLGYVFEDNLFSGDILFADGSSGEVNHKYSDPLGMAESINFVRNFKGRVYPGHGDYFLLP